MKVLRKENEIEPKNKNGASTKESLMQIVVNVQKKGSVLKSQASFLEQSPLL